MTLAKDINKKLDELLFVQSQIKEIKENLPDEALLTEIKGGKPVSREIVLNKGKEQLQEIKDDLNELTHDGKNCRDVFTNQYYVNDLSQDKLIAEEIRLNKMEECLAKQNKPENN